MPLSRSRKECAALHVCGAQTILVKVLKSAEVATPAEGHWVAGAGEAGGPAFTVHPPSPFEFGAMGMHYLAKTLFNLTK